MDWVKDDDVKNCMRCNVPFTALRRKHHCRICKKVFCDSCTSKRLPINNVMERVCKDCYASEKTKRDEWDLITNRGSPCGKPIKYPDFGCMKREDGRWSCKENPYMVLDLEKKIWTVEMDETKNEQPVIPEVEKPRPASSSSLSSLTSKNHRELISFKDIVTGNVPEDVLKATTVIPSQEKVYELERLDGCCQTDPLPAVSIPPVTYLSLSPQEIQNLRDSQQNSVQSDNEDEEIMTPVQSQPCAESTLDSFSERSEIIQLTAVVTEYSKQYRQRMSMVKDRRQLKEEQEEDEKEAKEAKEAKLQKVQSDCNASIDESKMVLDNLVTHFQSLSSRYNKMKSMREALPTEITNMEEKVKASQEQFQTLSHDTLMQIAAQQLVHLQHFRSISSAYKVMYEEEAEFAQDCMTTLMEQQETINQCLNGCINSVTSLDHEFEALREQCNEWQKRANVNEDLSDKTVEEASEVIQAAEKLSFLNEQQVYDIEKQYRNQEKKLSEVQMMLELKVREIEKLKRELNEMRVEVEKEKKEEEDEMRVEQWKPVSCCGEVKEEENERNSLCDNDDVNQIHSILSNWGLNKSTSYVDEVEDWLESVLSGKKVEMKENSNTIQLTMFNLQQKELFLTKIVPLLIARKNLECYVQEHKRKEFDYRITVMNKDETIPAICVPTGLTPKGGDEDDDETQLDNFVEQEFVPLQNEGEDEEDMEELEPSEIEIMKSVVAEENQSNMKAPKDKKRKAKMISLD